MNKNKILKYSEKTKHFLNDNEGHQWEYISVEYMDWNGTMHNYSDENSIYRHGIIGSLARNISCKQPKHLHPTHKKCGPAATQLVSPLQSRRIRSVSTSHTGHRLLSPTRQHVIHCDCGNGRRHGFESGRGDIVRERSEQKIFVSPWGTSWWLLK